MIDIQGTSDTRFDPVKTVIGDLIDSGEDVGMSVCVLSEGKSVMDVWAGWADEAKTRPWERDTITNVWSTTKTMVSLCALMLIDRGKLDPDATVAGYWPEFAANGKDAITVAQLLSHTSGVSGWEQPVVVEDLYDWEKSTAMLAAQAPWWEPGTASGYHALNFGHLIGEVMRRIDGRKPGQFFAEEVAGPLGADFHIGLADSEFGRIANVIAPPPLPLPEGLAMDSIPIKTLTGPLPAAEVTWTPEWRRADIGAANGHGNARSVARAQAVIANGGAVDGIRLLSQDTIEEIFHVYASGPDLVLSLPITFGLGYGLDVSDQPYVPKGKVCFWGGYGGSVIINDCDRKLTTAYMMNKMGPGVTGSPSTKAIVEAVYGCVD